jgi:3-hydroxybutyryl-CoA dehydratase
MRYDELTLGMTASRADQVTLDTIRAFAAVSGDVNPLHVDAEFAKRSSFGGIVAHGTLLAAYVSAVLGLKLPGPGTIAREFTQRYRGAVRPGDLVVTTVKVIKLEPKLRKVTCECTSHVNSTLVARGQASMLCEA